MKKYAIIVAAGSGSRMQSDTPKQFMLLNGKPVFFYSVNTFLEAYDDITVLLILPEKYPYLPDEILQYFAKKSQIEIITGGDTRFASVRSGLDEIHDEGIVFIHDAVRPFIDKKLLDELFFVASEKGNAVPYTDVKDSLRFVSENENHVVNRQHYKAIQTPQVFNVSLIKKAFEQPYNEIFTDDASVLESTGEKINLVKGVAENIKITLPVDWIVAETILKNL